MAYFLRGRNFENIEAGEVGTTEFFASKPETGTSRNINLSERCLKIKVSTLKSSLISCQKTFQIKFYLRNGITSYEKVSVNMYLRCIL